jgi:hypothetical protein
MAVHRQIDIRENRFSVENLILAGLRIRVLLLLDGLAWALVPDDPVEDQVRRGANQCPSATNIGSKRQ